MSNEMDVKEALEAALGAWAAKLCAMPNIRERERYDEAAAVLRAAINIPAGDGVREALAWYVAAEDRAIANDETIDLREFSRIARAALSRAGEGWTEFAWLIEAGDPPHYWNGRSPGSYTSDANDAVRFARFEDAERVRCWLITSGKHWKSVQHGWSDPQSERKGDVNDGP